MHLYKSLGVLLKENNKLKNANVLFVREKHNSDKKSCLLNSQLLPPSPMRGQYLYIHISLTV